MVDEPTATQTPQPTEHPEDLGAESLLDEIRRHKVPTAVLVLCIIAGAVVSTLYLPESISTPRRVAGGAVLGALSWLLVMVGRIIGGDD